MSPTDIFESAELKLQHAQRHLDRLDDLVQEFLDATPFAWTRELRDGGRENVFRLQTDVEPPAMISLVAGDCLYNTRAALDHMVYALAHHQTSALTPDQEQSLQFPIRDKSARFASVARKSLCGIDQAGRSMIKSLQPFDGGQGTLLRPLRELSNVDKHRRLTLLAIRPDSASWVPDEGDPDPVSVEWRFAPLDDGDVIATFIFDEPHQVDPLLEFEVADKAHATPLRRLARDILDHVRGTVLPAFRTQV